MGVKFMKPIPWSNRHLGGQLIHRKFAMQTSPFVRFDFSKYDSSAESNLKSKWFRLFLIWWGTSLLGAALAQCLLHYRNAVINRSQSNYVPIAFSRLII
ncbi:MAG: hypothetical protein ACTS6G_05620 [Candidatus Hodgkinia cicadicola]